MPKIISDFIIADESIDWLVEPTKSAQLTDGTFVVGFQRFIDNDYRNVEIYIQLFDINGNIIGDKFFIENYTSNANFEISLANPISVENNHFVVTWKDKASCPWGKAKLQLFRKHESIIQKIGEEIGVSECRSDVGSPAGLSIKNGKEIIAIWWQGSTGFLGNRYALTYTSEEITGLTKINSEPFSLIGSNPSYYKSSSYGESFTLNENNFVIFYIGTLDNDHSKCYANQFSLTTTGVSLISTTPITVCGEDLSLPYIHYLRATRLRNEQDTFVLFRRAPEVSNNHEGDIFVQQVTFSDETLHLVGTQKKIYSYSETQKTTDLDIEKLAGNDAIAIWHSILSNGQGIRGQFLTATQTGIIQIGKTLSIVPESDIYYSDACAASSTPIGQFVVTFEYGPSGDYDIRGISFVGSMSIKAPDGQYISSTDTESTLTLINYVSGEGFLLPSVEIISPNSYASITFTLPDSSTLLATPIGTATIDYDAEANEYTISGETDDVNPTLVTTTFTFTGAYTDTVEVFVGNGVSPNITTSIPVTPNQPLVIQTNSIPFDQGTSDLVLTASHLKVIKSDPPYHYQNLPFTYTLSDPTHITFKNATTGATLSTFTQTQIEAGEVTASHDGSECPHSAKFVVTDGGSPSALTPIGVVYNNVNQAPTLVNPPLSQSALPGGEQYSFPVNSSVVCTDPDRDDPLCPQGDTVNIVFTTDFPEGCSYNIGEQALVWSELPSGQLMVFDGYCRDTSGLQSAPFSFQLSTTEKQITNPGGLEELFGNDLYILKEIVAPIAGSFISAIIAIWSRNRYYKRNYELPSSLRKRRGLITELEPFSAQDTNKEKKNKTKDREHKLAQFIYLFAQTTGLNGFGDQGQSAEYQAAISDFIDEIQAQDKTFDWTVFDIDALRILGIQMATALQETFQSSWSRYNPLNMWRKDCIFSYHSQLSATEIISILRSPSSRAQCATRVNALRQRNKPSREFETLIQQENVARPLLHALYAQGLKSLIDDQYLDFCAPDAQEFLSVINALVTKLEEANITIPKDAFSLEEDSDFRDDLVETIEIKAVTQSAWCNNKRGITVDSLRDNLEDIVETFKKKLKKQNKRFEQPSRHSQELETKRTPVASIDDEDIKINIGNTPAGFFKPQNNGTTPLLKKVTPPKVEEGIELQSTPPPSSTP